MADSNPLIQLKWGAHSVFCRAGFKLSKLVVVAFRRSATLSMVAQLSALFGLPQAAIRPTSSGASRCFAAGETLSYDL